MGLQLRDRYQEAINTTQRKHVTDLANKHDGGSAAIRAVFVGHSFENLAMRLKVS